MPETVRVGDYNFRKNNVYYYKAELFEKFGSLLRSIGQKRIYYPSEPLLLVINSKGGLPYVEFYFDTLLNNGIITLGYSLVLSAAVSLMQVGEKRYSHKTTVYYIHRTLVEDENSGGGSNLREISDEELREDRPFMGRDVLAARTGMSIEEQFERYGKRHPTTPSCHGTLMSPLEAKAEGLIDEIVEVPAGLELALKRAPKNSVGFLRPNY